MMQLARQFSRLFVTAKQPREPEAAHAQDVREEFRTERAAITQPDTMPDLFGATGADWSDTLAMLSQWNDEALAADFDDRSDIDHSYSSLNL